jgi:F-type H+-transporting ATPase subunit epsilon
MANFTLEITSLKGILFNGQCHLAVIPGSSGDIGIMQDHESIITSLREGKIEIFDDKQNLVQSFDVKGGFAKMISEDKLVVLLD